MSNPLRWCLVEPQRAVTTTTILLAQQTGEASTSLPEAMSAKSKPDGISHSVCVCVRVKPGYKWTLKFCRGTGDDWPIQRSHVAFRCAAPSWLDDVNYVNISLDSFTIPFAQGRFLQLFWQVVQWSIEYCKVPCSCEPSSKCVFAASPHCGVLSFGRRIHTRILTAFSSQHDTPCYFGSTSKMLLPSCKATGCFMIFDGTQR